MAFSTFVVLTLLLLAFSPLPVQPQTAVPDPCTYVCDRSSNPVCGSDGITYSNPCVLLYFSCYYTGRNLVKRHNGACIVERPCPTTCPGSMAPVCGSDGRTYTNQCFLNREACAGRSVTLAKQGPCTTCRQICTREYVPVCGTNGLTYPNQCVLESKACEGQQVTKAYDGVCTPMACRQICTREYVPVCGSDGVTYSNQCVMESKACSGQRVTKAYDGPCNLGLQPQQPCDMGCPTNYAPVCGSDGKTYGNECALQAASCRGPTITKISNGECGTRQQPCPDACPASYAPVCGSDGKTYTNECVLKGVSCRNSSLTLSYPGQCASSGGSSGGSTMCTQACPITYAPVCGSDRVTYTNACTFGNAVCKDTTLSKLYDGPCRN